MQPVMEVHLLKTKFYSFHGLQPGEEIVGGEFEVSLTVTYSPSELPVTRLHETVDYTKLYAVVKEKMKNPSFLLETIATETAGEIFAKFPNITEVVISITKLHPPIENFEGAVGVTFKTKRN